jgi:hypothetical protein
MKTPACFTLWPAAVTLLCAASAFSQEPTAQDGVPSSVPRSSQAPLDSPEPSQPPGATPVVALPAEPPGGKRVFGVLPNYRTADASEEGTVLTPREKFVIASKDSFDYPLVALGGAFAALGQLTNADPSFGQGMKGFGHRLATNYADQALGNMFTEGVFPVLLHEDPRYFRLGTGNKWHRTAYAFTRVFVTHVDSGGTRFNYSEWLGNAAAVAISNTYYPDNRSATDATTKLLEQVGTDAISQVLKEFWPDIKHKLFHK